MSRVDWSEQALEDFEAALAYIAADNFQNAELVRSRILNILKHLESFSLGTPAPNETLKVYIPKTSYFVVFRRDTKDNISIRAFIHAARDWEKVNWDKI